jgi:outer membrane receptor protein involved in Fe transport
MSVPVVSGAAAVEQKRSYNLPSGDAASTLNQFAGASGQQIIFMMDKVKGERTNAVAGDYAARDALDRMLAGTGLSATRDPATGAFVVSRKPQKGEVGTVSDQKTTKKTMTPKPLHARLTAALLALTGPLALGQSPAADAPDSAVKLQTFEVRSEKDYGYKAVNSLTATRTATDIFDTPFSISVVTESFLKDIDALTMTDALKYVSSVTGEARNDGASRGNFGVGNGSIRGFQVDAILRNGVNRRGSFSLANISRIEVLKGPVSVFFGSAQPGGTINYITKRPDFRREANISTTVQSYDTSKWRTRENTTGGITADLEYQNFWKDKVAYRIYANSFNRNGWHDHERFHGESILPSVLIRPWKWVTLTLEYEHVTYNAIANAGAAAIGNAQWAADFENPPADVLATNNLTATRYRQNIFANNTNWRNYTLLARGNSAAAVLNGHIYRFDGLGRDVYPSQLAYSKPSFNFQGRGHYVDSFNDSGTVDLTLKPLDWFSFHYAYVDSRNVFDTIQTSAAAINGPYSVNLATGQGGANYNNSQNHQFDALFDRKIWKFKNQLLLGFEYYDFHADNYTKLFDYSKAPSVTVPAGTWVTQIGVVSQTTAPTILAGADAIRNWDPRYHGAVPDSSLYYFGGNSTSFSSTVTNGRYGQFQTETNVLGHRIIASYGERREGTGINKGRGNPFWSSGKSSNIGLTVGVTDWLNFIASTSKNYRPNAPGFPGGGLSAEGVGLNRDASGNLVPGLDEARSLPDQTGKGRDIGFKMSSRDGKWWGTFTWFQVERANIRIKDQNRSFEDPRNLFGSLYPNGFNADGSPRALRFVDAGFQPISFSTTTGTNKNTGFEGELIWSPMRNFQLIASATNIYDSKTKNAALTGVERDVLLARRIAYSPEYAGSLFGRYTFTSGHLKGVTVGGGARGATSYAPRYDSFGDNGEFNKNYVVGDANISVATKLFDRPSTVALSVANLFDRLYSTGQFAYAEPRKISLRVSLKL